MQNYTYFEQIFNTFFKKCIFRAFLKFYSTLPPLKQKVLPPPAGPFSTPLLPPTTMPKYGCIPTLPPSLPMCGRDKSFAFQRLAVVVSYVV